MNEILLYGVCGEDYTSAWVRSQLEMSDRSEMLTVRIHSEGGQVFEGFAIFEAFKSYDGPVRAVIEGAAFSIASFIAMAFDDLSITPNGWLMIHNPTVVSQGDANKLSSQADVLMKLQDQLIDAYAERSNRSREQIKQMMQAETWVSAKQSIESGFVKRIEGEPKTQPLPQAIEKFDVALPTAVYASIYSPAASNETERKPVMSKDVINNIKKLVPKATSEFIVKCMSDDLDDAGILKAAADEQSEANAKLAEQLDAANAELEASRQKIETLSNELEQATAKLSNPQPQAKAIGHDPVPMGDGTGIQSARAEWETRLAAEESRGLPRSKALMNVNRKFPGLRERMLEEMRSAS